MKQVCFPIFIFLKQFVRIKINKLAFDNYFLKGGINPNTVELSLIYFKN